MALAHGLVQKPLCLPHGLFPLCARLRCVAAVVQPGGVALQDVPDPVEPPGHAVDSDIAPGAALVPGADEHQETADGIGAQLGDDLVRIDHVAAALAHLLVVFTQDYTLVVQAEERFVEMDQAQVVQGLDEEPGVKEVHDGVLRAAGVLVHGKPAVDHRRVHGASVVAGAQVAHHVPGRVHKGVHGVGLAARRAAALGARRVDEPLVPSQGRLAGGLEFGIARQQHRELVFEHRDHAARTAICDGYGGAPVSLAGYEPVAQTVGHSAAPPAVCVPRRRRWLQCPPGWSCLRSGRSWS